MKITINPIGVIRTPIKSGCDTSIQSRWSEIEGVAQLFSEYIDGLESLDGFSHIILLYWFHRAKSVKMRVVPYLDKEERGLFSTRAPNRPNPIGLSIVKLLKIEGSCLTFEGADMLDESPLIDIKPFVPDFDNRLSAASGWISKSLKNKDQTFRADDRFNV